jgi:hypothetical protein
MMGFVKQTSTRPPKDKCITLPVVEEKGYVQLKDYDGPEIDPSEWEPLEYLDWKSGGDTNFAILASADGAHDPRGFWEKGKADKDGIWVEDNIAKAPTLRKWVENVGANYGRVRIIKLEANTYEDTMRNLHLDDNNRITEEGSGWVVRVWLQLTDNPKSYMVLRDNDKVKKGDPDTEVHLPCHKGAQFIVDSERMWHSVTHDIEYYTEPRYALITSFESGEDFDRWIKTQLPE